MQGMYTVIVGAKGHTDLTFLEALRVLQEAFEAKPDKAVKVEMFRQLSR